MQNKSYAQTFTKYEPMGCQKVWKEDQRGPRCIQRETPESFQDQRCDQSNPEKVSRRGPEAPEAPQWPDKAEKYEIPEVKLMFLRKTIKFLK